MKMYIGTSGFIYSKWKGKFYPTDIPKYQWFDYYAKHFNSLELNSTFYKIPKESTIKSWKYKLKKYNLKMSIKANQNITHKHKLKNPDLAIEFLNLLTPIKDYLGAVLFQLPPSLKYDNNLLNEFLLALPKDYKYAIEFRHKSWYNDKPYQTLKENKTALVWHDFNQPFVLEKTARFTYTRFHGYTGKYKGSYPDEFLETIINRSKTGFCYFNNTDDVSAPFDALRLLEMLGKK
jgi:uncharacterized protein YecE (DUF72 family)